MNTTTEPKTEKGKEEYDPAYIEIKGIGADEAINGMETERLIEMLEDRGYRVEKIREVEE